MRLFVLLLGGLPLLAACHTPPTADDSSDVRDATAPAVAFADEADYRRQREAAATRLAAAVEPARASSVAACRVVPTSEQACGGPTTFAVFSAEDPDAAETERLAARLVALDRQANRQFGWASTCMAYAPPTPALRDGRCVAR